MSTPGVSVSFQTNKSKAGAAAQGTPSPTAAQLSGGGVDVASTLFSTVSTDLAGEIVAELKGKSKNKKINNAFCNRVFLHYKGSFGSPSEAVRLVAKLKAPQEGELPVLRRRIEMFLEPLEEWIANEKRRDVLQQRGETLRGQCRACRERGEQPPKDLDAEFLKLMLDFIVHDETYGSSETLEKRKRTLFNICFTSGLLSKYQPYSMNELYKYTYAGGEYGYNFWDALEFMAHTFLVPSDQPLGAFQLNIDLTIVQTILDTELQKLKRIIEAELSANPSSARAIRRRYKTKPHEKLSPIYSICSFFQDKLFLDKLLTITKLATTSETVVPDVPDLNLKWEVSFHRQAILGIFENVGEFLQEQHLSPVCRSAFLEDDLVLLRDIRNRLEHVESYRGMLDGVFTMDMFNRMKLVLEEIRGRLQGIYDRDFTGIDDGSHIRYFTTHYEQGSRPLTDTIIQSSLNGISPDTAFYARALEFCVSFRIKVQEKPVEYESRFLSDLKKHMNFDGQTSKLFPGGQVDVPLEDSLKESVRTIHRQFRDALRVALPAEKRLNLDVIRELLALLPETNLADIDATHFDKVRRQLVGCLSTLKEYNGTTWDKEPAFPDKFLDVGDVNHLHHQIASMSEAQKREWADIYEGIISRLQRDPDYDNFHIVNPIQFEAMARCLMVAILGSFLSPAGVKPEAALSGLLTNSIQWIKLHTLSSELDKNQTLKLAFMYNLKALSSLLLPEHLQLVPSKLAPEIRAMRNVYAHSNPYFDKNPLGEAVFLIRYASVLLKLPVAPAPKAPSPPPAPPLPRASGDTPTGSPPLPQFALQFPKTGGPSSASGRASSSPPHSPKPGSSP